MKPVHAFILSAGVLLAGVTFAQSPLQPAAQSPVPASGRTVQHRERPFALVVNASMRFSGSHAGYPEPLYRYVHDHAQGTYVVFEQDGALYRIDNATRLAEIRRLYAPLTGLQVQGEALAHAQQPLAAQQKSLADQQQAATDPRDKGRIGAVQGAIGQEQGSLGAVQGELGQQQGEVARAAFERVQSIFIACLADGSCPRITA